VFGLFKKRTAEVEPKKLPSGNLFAQQAEQVLEKLQQIANGEKEVFALLGGAVFALQQDTIRAMAFDMRQLPDPITQAAMDKLQPHPAGDYAERYRAMFSQLEGITNAYLDALEDVAGREVIERLFLNMAAMAARIWLVTIESHATNDTVQKMRVLAIWKILDILEVGDIIVYAKDYTGKFYNGVRCETFQSGHWGLLPQMR